MTSEVTKAFVSFRIGGLLWQVDEQFDALIKLLNKYDKIASEIAFFLSETHSPMPLEYIKSSCKVLSKRVARLKSIGYRAGINNLCTTGHHLENFAYSLKGDFTYYTNIDGELCKGGFCPNNTNYREQYVKPMYEMIAGTGSDFIWIDDDVRLWGHMAHIPINETCFCDHCLQMFSSRAGKDYTRQALKTAFKEGSTEEQIYLRSKWLDHTRETIRAVLEFVANVIHEVSPTMDIGFMDGMRFYEGLGLEEWAQALNPDKKCNVMWRPGGGAYTDEYPNAMFAKAHVIGMESEILPKTVLSIQSEIENFPYQPLRKSAQFNTVEIDAYVAAGATGAALNILSDVASVLQYQPLLERLQQNAPFLDLLASAFGRSRRQGIYTGWNKYSFAARNLNKDWLSPEGAFPGWAYADEIFMMGLPQSYSLDGAQVTTLCEDCIKVLPDKEIQKILAGGVYMDAASLQHLNNMGYSELTGFEIEKQYPMDTKVILTDHQLNAGYGGFERDARQSFHKGVASNLIPQTGAESLAYLIDYSRRTIGDCAIGIFENSLGGRVCVSGYFPWDFLYFMETTIQIKNIMKWLSKDSLGAFIGSYHRVSLWDSLVGNNHVTALVNGFLDPAINVELNLKTDCDSQFELVDMFNNRSLLQVAGKSDGYTKIIIPEIKPWHICLIFENAE